VRSCVCPRGVLIWRSMDSNGIVKEDEDADVQDAMPETLDEAVFEEYFGVVENEDLIVIRSYSGDDDDRLLEELRPKYIIMYDPDPAFIRRIEVGRCHFPFSDLKSCATDVQELACWPVHARLLFDVRELGRGAALLGFRAAREGGV
jgi:hypothetical protein